MMHNNDDMLFDATTKKGIREGDIKISIIELNTNDDNSPCLGQERTQTAIKSSNAGIWTLDIATNSLMVCKRCNEIISIWDLKNVNIKLFSDLIGGGYKKGAVKAIFLAIKKGVPFDMEVPVIAGKNSCPK